MSKKTENTLLILGVGGVLIYFMAKEGKLPSPAGMVQSMLPQFNLPQFPDYNVPALDPSTGCGGIGGTRDTGRSGFQAWLDNFFGTPDTGRPEDIPKDITIHAPTATIELAAFETPFGRTEIYPILPPFVSFGESIKSWLLGPLYTIPKHGGLFPIGTKFTDPLVTVEPATGECPSGTCPVESGGMAKPFFIPQKASAAPSPESSGAARDTEPAIAEGGRGAVDRKLPMVI